jgi:exopolyphosphatase/pppGpp-phosphohydrolase
MSIRPPPQSDNQRNSEAALRQLYASLHRDDLTGSSLSVLHIGGEHIRLISGDDVEPAVQFALPIGTSRIAGEHFRHVPPTGGEMEMAIMSVEDAIASAPSLPSRHSVLYTSDALIKQIALLAGLKEMDGQTITLSCEAVEQTFERLSRIALGGPIGTEVWSTDREFAAGLLILRELLHHLSFPTIAILPGGRN